MFRLIIFDMDGLMFDTEAVMCRAFLEVTARKGYPATKEHFLSLLGMNGPDIQNKFRQYYGQDIDAEELYRVGGERKMEILKQEGLPVKKGLYELLEAAGRLGIRKAVASGSDERDILAFLDQAGLRDSFDMVLSAREVKRGKPHPDIFLTVCNKLSVPPEETLVLEDSLNGVEAAIAGGIPVIQIPDFLTLPEETREKCLAVCSSLDEVIPYLEQSHGK